MPLFLDCTASPLQYIEVIQADKDFYEMWQAVLQALQVRITVNTGQCLAVPRGLFVRGTNCSSMEALGAAHAADACVCESSGSG